MKFSGNEFEPVIHVTEDGEGIEIVVATRHDGVSRTYLTYAEAETFMNLLANKLLDIKNKTYTEN